MFQKFFIKTFFFLEFLLFCYNCFRLSTLLVLVFFLVNKTRLKLFRSYKCRPEYMYKYMKIMTQLFFPGDYEVRDDWPILYIFIKIYLTAAPVKPVNKKRSLIFIVNTDINCRFICTFSQEILIRFFLSIKGRFN